MIETNKSVMLISASVPKSWNEQRKAKGMTWRGLILRGFEQAEVSFNNNMLQSENIELKKRIERMKDLLDKYIKLANGGE